MLENRVEKIPLISKDDEIMGLITLKDINRYK